MGIERALFIIVTICLILLVIAAIVGVVLIITLLKSLQRLASKAEEATENMGQVAKQIGRRVGPAVLSTLLATGFRQWRKTRRRD